MVDDPIEEVELLRIIVHSTFKELEDNIQQEEKFANKYISKHRATIGEIAPNSKSYYVNIHLELKENIDIDKEGK